MFSCTHALALCLPYPPAEVPWSPLSLGSAFTADQGPKILPGSHTGLSQGTPLSGPHFLSLENETTPVLLPWERIELGTRILSPPPSGSFCLCFPPGKKYQQWRKPGGGVFSWKDWLWAPRAPLSSLAQRSHSPLQGQRGVYHHHHLPLSQEFSRIWEV